VHVNNLQITAFYGSLKALQHVRVNVVCIEFRIFQDIFDEIHNCCGCETVRECLSAYAFKICSLPVMTSALILQHLCPEQAKVSPAQIETSNIVHDIVSDIVYDIEYNNTDIVYDIDIRYRIPINMEEYGLVLSYVYIVPLFYLNSLSKRYSSWNRSLQGNGKALQSPVEVFWIEVQPIWNTTQELMNWSRIGSRELSCRNILVHEITMIVKVHFAIFIAVTGRQTWKTWSCVGTPHHISASISYTILRTLQNDALCTLDIDTISKKNRRYRVRYSISSQFSTIFVHSILIRYLSFYSISCTISYGNIGI
jgi:hypothetical protein